LPELLPDQQWKGMPMAKGQIRSNKEAKKPKKEKPKVLATAGMTPAAAAPAKKK
jgi:hypothetical protein